MVSALYARSSSLLHMSDDDTRTPGEVLRELRDKRGWSMRTVAERSGLSHGTIQNLEKKIGAYDFVQSATVESAARGYQISVERMRDILAGRGVDFMGPATMTAAHLKVHPDWILFPVRSTISAGEADAEYLTGEVAYIPRDHLRRKGTMPDDVDMYQVNGNCMVSDEARRIEKNIADGDYIAVDRRRSPEVGDVVAAWWPDARKLVVKRYKIEGENIVLYPITPGHPSVMLPAEDALTILGRVVWRGG